MKLVLFERDNRKLVQGIVVEKTPGKGNAAGRVLNVKIKANVYNKDTKAEEETTMDIAFWNSESSKLADSANTRLQVGNYVSVLVSEKDGKFSASAMKKSGIWRFGETYDDTGNVKNAEANIIIGLVSSGSVSPANASDETMERYRISVPISHYDAEGNSTSEWISITFFNNDTAPKLAQNAKKVLAPYTPDGAEKPIRHRAAIRCGKLNPYTGNDGVERATYTGYSFDRLD